MKLNREEAIIMFKTMGYLRFEVLLNPAEAIIAADLLADLKDFIAYGDNKNDNLLIGTVFDTTDFEYAGLVEPALADSSPAVDSSSSV